MSSSQQDVTREVLHSVHDFLGGPTPDGDEWCFEFGEHLHSNWGAVYGGALAASTLAVARSAAPDRSPRSLHIQIVRSVPSGIAYATAEVRHAGRTVATVQVEMFDVRRKLAVIALVTMVTPDALAADVHNTTADQFQRHRTSHSNWSRGSRRRCSESLQMLTERRRRLRRLLRGECAALLRRNSVARRPHHSSVGRLEIDRTGSLVPRCRRHDRGRRCWTRPYRTNSSVPIPTSRCASRPRPRDARCSPRARPCLSRTAPPLLHSRFRRATTSSRTD